VRYSKSHPGIKSYARRLKLLPVYSASRLSTSLHAARHHETTQDTDGPLLQPPDDSRHPSEPGTLSDLQSAITLFLISWPVLAVFVGFVWTSGWIELDWMLTFWVMVVYGVTVRLSRLAFGHEADESG
jgi:hypothetical protein